jgi:DNA-binding NarL/FixJ family response regulator
MAALRSRQNGRPPNPGPPVVAAVASDAEAMRSRIIDALAREGIDVSARAARPEELIDRCRDRPPDVVVMSGSPAVGELTTAVRRLRRRLPTSRIVVIARSGDRRAVQGAMSAGADGALWDSALEVTLACTAWAACAGQVAVPSGLSRHVVKPVLSHREKQVLGMVVAGLTNAEIAGTLQLTESTVKSHLSRAFGKLGVRSRHEAAGLLFELEAGDEGSAGTTAPVAFGRDG